MTGDESSRMFCIRQPNKDGVTKKPPAAQTASESSKDKQSAHGREVMSRQRLFQTSVNLEKKKKKQTTRTKTLMRTRHSQDDPTG